MSRLDRIADWEKLGRKAMYDCSKLAKLCLVSPTQLRRYFVLKFRKPPQRLLTEMRLWDAAHLLCSSQLSVKDIARELDFANESLLCHQFKAYFRCRPSEFAQLHQSLKGSPSTKLPESPAFVMQRRADGAPLWKALAGF